MTKLSKSVLNRAIEAQRDLRPIARRILMRGEQIEILQECVALQAKYATIVSLRHIGFSRSEAAILAATLLEMQGEVDG